MGLFSRIRNIVETDPLVIRDRIDNAAANSAKYPAQQPDTLAQQFNRLNAPTQAAPGSVSPVIQTTSPTQAEQIAAGARSAYDTEHANAYGNKDVRNKIALRDVEYMQEIFKERGLPSQREDVVDFFNERVGDTSDDNLARAGQVMGDFRGNDTAINNIVNSAAADGFQRLAPKPQGFVGEGMFGQVTELAPGYVEKTTPPVVEWPALASGAPNAGRLYDYRDFDREQKVSDYLSDIHITPKIEAFNVNPDGSTETIMKDLRENFEGGESVYTDLIDKIQSASTPEESAQAFARKGILDVKRKQQEAMAISKGIELGDRHEGNVMFNKMTGRPLQIDTGIARFVEGFDRDDAMIRTSLDGMRAAGLEEEADFFAEVVQDAYDRDDAVEFHNLAQQGASLLAKIKSVPTNYSYAGAAPTSISDSLFTDSIPF